MVIGAGPVAPTAVLRVSVVIPTLDEAENLPYVLARVPEWVHEVVVVDGRSTDDTVGTAIRAWPNNHIVTEERRRAVLPVAVERRIPGPTLRIVLETRPGKGVALQSGFGAATGDIIVMLDADGSTDPAEIPVFVGALLSGADFVKGSRFLQGGGTADMPFHRRLGNRGFVAMVRLLVGGSFSDLLYGYNAFWSQVAPLLRLDTPGFEIETQMNVRALQLGLKIAEVPSFEAERLHGVGRLQTFPDGWRVLKTLLREWATPKVRRLTEGQRRQLLAARRFYRPLPVRPRQEFPTVPPAAAVQADRASQPPTSGTKMRPSAGWTAVVYAWRPWRSGGRRNEATYPRSASHDSDNSL